MAHPARWLWSAGDLNEVAVVGAVEDPVLRDELAQEVAGVTVLGAVEGLRAEVVGELVRVVLRPCGPLVVEAKRNSSHSFPPVA